MNKDEAKGRVKEAAGKLTDDHELQAKGKSDRGAGKAKDMIESARQKVDHAIDSVRGHFDHD
jgi:uncharacterized protein YjbJ (UPF0337 family)